MMTLKNTISNGLFGHPYKENTIMQENKKSQENLSILHFYGKNVIGHKC